MRQTIKHATLHPRDQAERDSFNEHKDCTVVALAAAADIPYSEAHALLAKAGRLPRHGFKLRLWLDNQCFAARMRGGKFRLGKYSVERVVMFNRDRVTLAQFLRDFPRGRFVCRKRSHAFAVIDGKVLNLFTGARTRITNLWYLTEA